MENKDIQTKEDVLQFLRHWVDHSTCSQGKGKDVFFVSTDGNGNDEIIKGLPTGGCGDPHYLSRDQMFDILAKITTGELTQEELDNGEDY